MIPGLVALLALLSLASCREQERKVEKSPSPVHVEAAALITPQEGRRYSASITPYRQVVLAFRSGGFIDWLLEVRGADGRMRALSPGDTVVEGQVLARVRKKDYDLKISEADGQLGAARKTEAAARAQLAQAEAVAAKAALDFTRATNLFATQSITKPDYDSARAQRDAADAQVAAARAQLDAALDKVRAAEASLGEASLAGSDAEIRAPFDAYVVQRMVETGALVGTGSPGFALADLGSVKAAFGLPDVEVASLKTGATLTLTAEALPNRPFQGIVTAISPVADTSTRLFPVEITVPNSGRALLAGMIVSVEARAAQPQPVLVVPLGAVIRGSQAGAFGVMVVETAGLQTQAHSRAVTVGGIYGNRIQIASGLRAGERVVASGAALLANGEAVQVIP
jgi:multidrug efflux system membrane fusion protein